MNIDESEFNVPEQVYAIGKVDPHVASGCPVTGQTRFHRIIGTAFHISNQLLMTANHVVSDNMEELSIFSYSYRGKIFYSKFTVEHAWIEYDIALVRPNRPFESKVIYNQPIYTPCNLLDDVVTLGYPHGLDEFQTPRLRAFRGYICGLAPYKRNNINIGRAYETNFQSPRGLSGAPLLNLSSKLIGIMIATNDVWQSGNETDKFKYGVASPISKVLEKHFKD